LLPQDLEALAKGAPMPLSDAAAAAQASASQQSTSQLLSLHGHYDDHEKMRERPASADGTNSSNSVSSVRGGSLGGNGSGGSGDGHPEDAWGNTLGGEAKVAVVGRPPIAARYGPVAPSRWAALERAVGKALWLVRVKAELGRGGGSGRKEGRAAEALKLTSVFCACVFSLP